MTITIKLPFPNGKLSPNRAKGVHWGATSSLKGRQFDDACAAAYQAISAITAREWTPLAGRSIPLTVTFNEPDRRMRDLDNLLSASKSAIDGIATALTVNDKHFTPITIKRGEVIKGGQMVVDVD